jgi:hypothetical protein
LLSHFEGVEGVAQDEATAAAHPARHKVAHCSQQIPEDVAS